MLKKFSAEVRSHLVIYLVLGLVLALGLFVRVYRINDLLGFYYDQGRDALVVSDLIHKGDVPFIGPTTGIPGIFRGPFYYWLIAPFYLLGSGNPVWPSVFLSITVAIAILIMYYLGYKIHSRTTGLIAAIISAFSFNIVTASRWLSNPTPMLLLSMILVLAMLKVTEGKKVWWTVISFVFGLSLFHFGSSGEAFYLPALIVFAIWQRKNFLKGRLLLVTCVLLLVTILPLILFDIKNHGLLIGNIKNFLFGGEGTFGFPTWRHIGDKISFLYDVFTNKIYNGRYEKEVVLLSLVAIGFIYYLHNLVKNNGVKILPLLLGVGSLGIILFQGNFGNIYDYYLTGYYLPFILLFSIALGELWKGKIGKVFVLYFLYLFLANNIDILKNRLSDKCAADNSICFINQKQAIDWIYKDAGSEKFNVDVYVPPVIPYAYDYLFQWKSTPNLVKENISLLYTLYEQDPPSPDRLEAWLARQKGIGKIENSARFGGITVERRTRLQ